MRFHLNVDENKIYFTCRKNNNDEELSAIL